MLTLSFTPVMPHIGAMFSRPLYLAAGYLCLALGAIGALLPVVPTVPFVILAPYCFAHSSPKLEAWLLSNPAFGPHIIAWRDHGAISRRGKWAATGAFCASIVSALIFIPWPYWLAPLAAALITGTWIWRRPDGPKSSPNRPEQEKDNPAQEP